MKIGFSGDISFDEFTKDYYKQDILDDNIKEFLKENDYNVIDFESPITDSKCPTKKALYHKCNEQVLTFVKKQIKNPIFVIGNNHMMDYGEEGVLDTINTLNKNHYEYIGAGKDLTEASKYVIVGDDVKVGLMSIQYKDFMISTDTTPGPMHDSYKKLIKKRIEELKEKVDYVVVVYHGGEEFLSSPMPYTKKLLKKYLKWGADIVVAHHPHVVQGYELINDKAIFYSLGNFIFDTEFQRAQLNTDIGTLLSIDFTKDGYTFTNLNIKIDRKHNNIVKYNEDTNFKQIDNYKSEWKKEIYRLSEIRRNKKHLKKTRINMYISDDTIDSVVPFKYFEAESALIEEEEIIVTKIEKGKKVIRKKVKKTKKKFNKTIVGKALNKIARVLKEKKYRYYLVGKLYVVVHGKDK